MIDIADTIAVAVLDRLRSELDEIRAAVSSQAPQRPELLTAAELAHELRVSRSTVARLRAEGLPVVMVIESPRYRLAEVIDWLRARQMPEAAE